jgi:hypothetical protein
MTRLRLLTCLFGLSLFCGVTTSSQMVSPNQIQTLGPLLSDSTSIVTGRPYESVEDVVLTTTAANGQKLVMELRVRRYRDSWGRTRIEGFSPDNGSQAGVSPSEIVIVDPTADVIHELRTETRTVYSVAISKLQIDAVLPPSGTDSSSAQGAESRPPDSVDDYVRSLRGPLPETKETVVAEDLGTQVLAGLVAYGERKTRSAFMRASSKDANQPVVDVKEDWRSRDLLITMLSKHSDSRFGEIDTRVTNIDRREPDPSLFVVPSDYTSQQP